MTPEQRSPVATKTRAKGFLIDSLPRCGSTTLAKLLNCYPGVNCLIEPFHPKQCFGFFHRLALAQRSAGMAMDMISCRWTGVKHVWDARSGWPFPDIPEINKTVLLGAGKLVLLQRRNLLRRFVSGYISNQLEYWEGTRSEFLDRIENISLTRLDPQTVKEEIARDRLAVERRIELAASARVPCMQLFYEDLYDQEKTIAQQQSVLNSLIAFLGFETLADRLFHEQCAPLLEPNAHRWADYQIYERIPGVDEIERCAGSDETGWLLKEMPAKEKPAPR